MQSPKLVHFTEGGPWHGYTRQNFSNDWIREFEDMLVGKNPCAHGIAAHAPCVVDFEVIYEQTPQPVEH